MSSKNFENKKNTQVDWFEKNIHLSGENVPKPIAEDYMEHDAHGNIHWCPSWNDCCNNAFRMNDYKNDLDAWNMFQAAHGLIKLKNSYSQKNKGVSKKPLPKSTGIITRSMSKKNKL